MKRVSPERPLNLDPLANDMLERLAETPEADHLVVGGGIALNCYAPPRMTHDLDAWWAQTTDEDGRKDTVARIREIAEDIGRESDLRVYERPRSADDVELEPPIVAASPFAPVAVETLADNLAAKMTALVARGAPRDFQSSGSSAPD